MALLNTTFEQLMAQHNELVKDAYIEISSNETLSGNPIIFEFEWMDK